MNFWQDLKKPIIGLAPMDGVTDAPMRQIQTAVAQPDVIYTEFVNVDGFLRNAKTFSKRLTFSENERPIVVQLYGKNPDSFYEAILKIAEFGHSGIDINFGCPAKKVMKSGGGGALIGKYGLAEKIIRACLNAIKEIGKEIPLSVKTRIAEDNKEWFKFLAQFPIAEVTIHGRFLREGLAGVVDWGKVSEGAEIIKKKNIICLGNGGIKSLSEAKEKCMQYGLDGVLIGRTAIGNPWIFCESYQPTQKEVFKTLLKHGQLICDFYGKDYLRIGFKHFAAYLKGFTGCKKLKLEIFKAKNMGEVKKILEQFTFKV